MVLVKEGIRVEALLRCACSENSAMALPLLTLLPSLLPPLLLRAVVFPGPLVTAVAGGAAPPAPSARPGRAPLLSHAWWLARKSLLGGSRTSAKGISAWVFSLY